MGKDREDPTKDVVQGLGLLFRAGRHAAGKLKKGFDKSHLARSIDDAGKEVARAADNVVNRIAGEVKKVVKDLEGQPPEPPKPDAKGAPPEQPGAGKDRDPAAHGPRIVVHDDEKR
jgi:hypothetical protein